MKKTIFVDMDGVLSDFQSLYVEWFGETPERTRMDKDKSTDGKSKFSSNWLEIVHSKFFESLSKHEGCDRLVSYLNYLNPDLVDIKILTSTGGAEFHNAVALQKLNWVKKHNIEYPVIPVPGRRFKSAFANENSMLIDDTLDVYESFIKHGGNAVLHKHVDTTVMAIKNFLKL